jgi:hypothetical protein
VIRPAGNATILATSNHAISAVVKAPCGGSLGCGSTSNNGDSGIQVTFGPIAPGVFPPVEIILNAPSFSSLWSSMEPALSKFFFWEFAH